MLKGKAKFVEREKHPCPKDGVHRMGRDGKIKGVHCIELNGKLYPKGMNCIFIDKGKTGYKVFYSLKWGRIPSKFRDQEIRNIKKLSRQGFAPKIIKKTKIKLDFTYRGKHIKCNAPAIEVEKVDVIPGSVEGVAYGRPYDWSGDTHPDHSPDGFRAFKTKCKKMIKKLKLKHDGSLKPGDVLWDRTLKKWLLVDCS